MPISAFLFDLDGVIVDTAVFHYQAWRRMANELGFDISHEFNETLKGVSRMDSLDLILAHGGVTLTDERKLELATQKNDWYLELVSRMTPNDILPGVAGFFHQLKHAQPPLKTALGSVSKNARLILERIHMVDQFDAIIDGTKITRGKPDPEVFLNGAAELGVAPADCVVFEDAVAGVEAAKRAGMFAVGIGSPDVLTEADLVVPSLEHLTVTELLAAVERAQGLGY
ncbi:beta-phosphoglucomutase [Rudanella paleaurantiibacter]|uniref:Beta-phosphoglucomutase n=1 Tax=Rudanella paleaurantiibacter TaxID=2614655 RepID=A0A7J5U5G6_9BACT|nr:beta-phosphoglucomutase [Rudanella paleaurantiibacter]KAB7733089.1 beta-phosphoglucomutase [Rudanella paleaurantiibacter]